MFYKRFRIQVLLRILLLLGLGYASLRILENGQYWLLAVWTILGMIGVVAGLIRYIERSHRELSNFVLSIEQGDFTNTYAVEEDSKSVKAELKRAYGRILNTMQDLRTEKESNHLYLQTIVKHIGVGLICYDEEGEIVLMNQAAEKLFKKPYLRSIQGLAKINLKLYNLVQELATGGREVFQFEREQDTLTLSIYATKFSLLDKAYKLVAFQNIKDELEAQEVESWQKLIRVLTHEIMNSAIPISSLSSIGKQLLEEDDGSPKDLATLDEDDVEDLRGSLKTIENRSKGLVSFVKAYKSLTQISPPSMSEIRVMDLFDRVQRLYKPRMEAMGIHFDVSSQEDLLLKADLELIEQVLINLLLNAMDAVADKEEPLIRMNAQQTKQGRLAIQVYDNGNGIEKEMLRDIFIPFFTTKAKGSGIGLSLSRQIMRMHKGSLAVHSDLGQGTVFTLTF